MKNKSFEIDGITYTFYDVQGIVNGKEKNFETKISGSGGGGSHYQGTGTTSGISISSSTIIHDNIFIETEKGNQTVVELQNWNVSVLEGQEVVAIWLIESNNNQGPYVAFINLTTEQRLIGTAAIDQLAKRPKNLFKENGCAVIVLFVVLGFCFSSLIYWVLGLEFFGLLAFLAPAAIYLFWFKRANDNYKRRSEIIHQKLNKYIEKGGEL